MNVPRLPDWLDRLTAYLDRIRALPYDAVQHNCATFIGQALFSVTGDDALKRLQIELPTSELGVARILTEFGGVRGLAEAYFGSVADPAVLQARRGDIAILDGIDGESLGVVESGGIVYLSPEGLWHCPLTEAKGFWRLG